MGRAPPTATADAPSSTPRRMPLRTDRRRAQRRVDELIIVHGRVDAMTERVLSSAACDSDGLFMRRLTPRYKRWLLRRARKQLRQRRRPMNWAWATVTDRAGERLARVLPHDVPDVLCLDKAYRETVGFIHDFRIRAARFPSLLVGAQLAKRGGRIGWIRNYQNFTMLREISPGAALLVAAEYDRSRALSGPLAAIELDKWDPSVRAALGALGFFGLLDVP
jgi:hypothetical protein